MVADAINDIYLRYTKKIAGLIVGGPGPNKDNFLKSKNLNYQVKVLGMFDTGYTDEHTGVNELLERSKELLSKQAIIKERAVMDRFLEEVARNGLAAYGYGKVKNALDNENVSKLIISEDLELTEVGYRCSNCKQESTDVEEGNFRKAKHDCGGTLEVVSQKDVVEDMIEDAEKKGVEMVFISPEEPHGKQLLLGFKGIAAMLRYRR
jgi:peptide chain release factor subunit 1